MTLSTMGELVLQRRFDASPERVFDAWIGADWGHWLPPRGATGRVVAIDPRPGGAFEVAMSMADGRAVSFTGRYEIVDRPRRLVFSWLGAHDPAELRVDLTFVADGDGTIMTLAQSGFPDDGMRDGYDHGWAGEGGSFDKLAASLG